MRERKIRKRRGGGGRTRTGVWGKREKRRQKGRWGQEKRRMGVREEDQWERQGWAVTERKTRAGEGARKMRRTG